MTTAQPIRLPMNQVTTARRVSSRSLFWFKQRP